MGAVTNSHASKSSSIYLLDQIVNKLKNDNNAVSARVSTLESAGYKNEAGVKSIVETYGYQTAAQVNTAIESKDYATNSSVNAKIGSTYRPKGSIPFSELPTATEENVGEVYDISNNFTTTASFKHGAGRKYPAGTNVAIIELETGTYGYDALSGLQDLSGLVEKETGKGLSSNDFSDSYKTKLDGIVIVSDAEADAIVSELFPTV